MNFGKLVSGLVALLIYLTIIFVVLYFYNIHQTKAKNYVEKNANRVTVTLVNSDKTVFNRSDKVSTPKKPVTPSVPIVPKHVVKKKTLPKKQVVVKKVPKRIVPKKVIPKKVVPKKLIPKKKVPKKVVPKQVIPKKKIPKKVIPKKIAPKKKIPKKLIPKKKVPKKTIPKKKIPKKVVPKKKVPKKTARDLFSSVKTSSVKKQPIQRRVKPPVIRQSSIKHNSTFADRTRATHQSGRTSNTNREKGIKNAYIAQVKRRMMNWNAVGAKGQMVTVNLTIYNSGKFRYTTSGVTGAMRNSLKHYLDTVNAMGLKRHKKSTPYSIQVRFKVR